MRKGQVLSSHKLFVCYDNTVQHGLEGSRYFTSFVETLIRNSIDSEFEHWVPEFHPGLYRWTIPLAAQLFLLRPESMSIGRVDFWCALMMWIGECVEMCRCTASTASMCWTRKAAGGTKQQLQGRNPQHALVTSLLSLPQPRYDCYETGSQHLSKRLSRLIR